MSNWSSSAHLYFFAEGDAGQFLHIVKVLPESRCSSCKNKWYQDISWGTVHVRSAFMSVYPPSCSFLLSIPDLHVLVCNLSIFSLPALLFVHVSVCLSVCLSVCHLSVSLFLPSLFSLLSLFSFLLSLLLYSTCFIGFNCVWKLTC